MPRPIPNIQITPMPPNGSTATTQTNPTSYRSNTPSAVSPICTTPQKPVSIRGSHYHTTVISRDPAACGPERMLTDLWGLM